jgi:hypothetical protein
MTPVDSLAFEPQLASTPSNYTINYFYQAHQNGDLVLQPPFQRNMVWNKEQQSFLIDSILRGLPVPEIYVQTETSAEGEERTVVVDGQQRITACILFIDDELRLIGDDELDIQWKNRVFSELEEPLRRRFRRYELVARKLPHVSNAVLREIFRRLNKTVEALEPQELRHAAYTGPFIRLVEDAAKAKILEDLGVFSAKDYLRRRNDELIAEIAYAVLSKAYPNKKDGLDELFLSYERHGVPAAVLEDLDRRFGRVFAEIGPIASSLRRTRFRNKSDFYSLFVFLAKNAEFLPLPKEGQDNLLLLAIREFSTLVNDIKREEADGRSIQDLAETQLGREAVKYLRAVERAASDRLNRVRREDALRSVLAPILATGEAKELSELDASWRVSPEESDSEDDDVQPDEEEREHTRDVLLEDV